MLQLLPLIVLLALTPGEKDASLGPCATPQILPSLNAPRSFPAAPLGSRDKENRNPFGVPNELTNENFVIRWGDDWDLNMDGIQDLSVALGDAWQTQIVEMDHPAPPSTDTTLMNVYIGDSGNGAPSAFGAGGYFTTDDDGFPMLVISQDSIWVPVSTRVVALHEFYHSVQWGLGTYSYDDDSPGAWYWEATASWIPSVTDPQSAENGSFLFGFGLLPHLELDSFDYPDTGALTEYHQYGAFIFPTYLSEWLGSPSAIRDSWVSPAGGTSDPIEALRGRLAEENIDFDDAFVDFVAANVFWDYVHGPAWEQFMGFGQEWYPNESPVTAWISTNGTDGFESAPNSIKPRRYGANVLRLDYLNPGEWVLEARFDETGSQGTSASWGVTLVRNAGDGVTYQRLEQSELSEGVTFETGGELAVAVAAWSDLRNPGERFDWEWSIRPLVGGDDDDDVADDDDAADDDDDATTNDGPVDNTGGIDSNFNGSGCACDAGSGAPASTSWLLLVLYGMFAPWSRRR